MPKLRAALIGLVALLAGCGGTAPTTTEPLAATTSTAGVTTTGSTATTSPGPAEPLIAEGCDIFDAAVLTELSPIASPLTLIEDTSTADQLVCNFVGVSDGLDTAIRVVIERTADKPDGHYTTAAEFESEVELGSKRGVGSGRGLVRLLLDEEKGLTLTLTIRSLSSEATIPRDGEFLDIRDAIATYLALTFG